MIDADQRVRRLQRLIHELSGTRAQRPVLLDAVHQTALVSLGLEGAVSPDHRCW